METESRVRFGIPVLVGVLGAVVGALFGLIVGANVGGNWFTSVGVGSLNGYEATGMLGAVIGGILVGIPSFWLALRRQR